MVDDDDDDASGAGKTVFGSSNERVNPFLRGETHTQSSWPYTIIIIVVVVVGVL